MLPTHDVDCPNCGRRLYTALSLEDVVAADAPTGPKVENDAKGDYLSCPHCNARIAMERITVQGRVGFRACLR